jgi:hypothetical protein
MHIHLPQRLDDFGTLLETFLWDSIQTTENVSGDLKYILVANLFE